MLCCVPAKLWLAFDVGCIECGEESNVLGIFYNEADAQSACDEAEKEQKKNWNGGHHFEVFNLIGTFATTPPPPPEIEGALEIAEEYKEHYLSAPRKLARALRQSWGRE